MIIELLDITGVADPAYGNVHMPPNTTIGDILDADERLKKFQDRIAKVSLNGLDVSDWKTLRCAKGDRLCLFYKPGEVGTIIGVLTAIISVVSFFISLFMRPTTPKPAKRGQSFLFEGARNEVVPDQPIPILYGRHDVAPQVLMYYVDIIDRHHQRFYELLALGEGPIDAVEEVTINDINIRDIGPEATYEVRVGQTSQTIISGFETIKNTFYHGVDFYPPEVHGTLPTTESIAVINTVNNDVVAVDLHILFPNGLVHISNKKGPRGLMVRYGVYYADLNTQVNTSAWIYAGAHEVWGVELSPLLDNFHIDLPKPSAYAFKAEWESSNKANFSEAMGRIAYQTRIQNVTEYRGVSGPFSGVAQLGVSGIGTKKLQGGQPVVRAVYRGRTVKNFQDSILYTTQWTQNPSWCVLDYMTNSIYGMGPYITEADIDLQSFLDFAALSDSQTVVCTDAFVSCRHSVNGEPFDGQPEGNNNFDGVGAMFGHMFDYAYNNEVFYAVSRKDGISNTGLTLCKNCCPPGNMNPFASGVSSPDLHCNAVEILAQYGGASGTPVSGLAFIASGTCEWNNFTGYALILDHTNSKVTIQAYSNTSLANTGHILYEHPSYFPPSGALMYASILQFDYNEGAPLFPGYATFDVFAYEGGWDYTGAVQLWDSFILGASPGSGQTWTKSMHLGHLGFSFEGMVTRPVNTGTYHNAKWIGFGQACGLCYSSHHMQDWTCDNEAMTVNENATLQPWAHRQDNGMFFG